jgi:hypothetical protein
MRRTSAKNRFTYATFSRAASNGRSIVYVRFIDTESGEIIAIRSTGKRTEKAARPRITELLAELDLKAMTNAKDGAREADLDDEERLAALSVFDFVNWFWSNESYYVTERKDAERPLSHEYVETSRSYIRTRIKRFEQFRLTTLKDIHLSAIEAFIRKLRRAGKPRDVIKRNIDAISPPPQLGQVSRSS